MKLHTLKTIRQSTKKRLGRGHGSGKVKTAGRGQKGQKARGSIKPGYEGGQVAMRHRLPLLRGKGRNSSQKKPVMAIPLVRIMKFYKDGETVSLESLVEKGLFNDHYTHVKLIGNSVVEMKLTVQVPTTSGAKKAIEKAGGSVTV